MFQGEHSSVTLDGVEYDVADLSSEALVQLRNVQFCNEKIQQLSSEWAIADTARLAYAAALKRDIQKVAS